MPGKKAQRKGTAKRKTTKRKTTRKSPKRYVKVGNKVVRQIKRNRLATHTPEGNFRFISKPEGFSPQYLPAVRES